LKDINQINRWVAGRTHGKINKIIDELSPDTKMLLVNAVYFSSPWEENFESYYQREFTNIDNQIVDKEFMLRLFRNTPYFEDDTVQAIQVPFKASKYFFYVFLPKGDINAYVDSLTDAGLQNVFNGMRAANVKLVMPEFTIEFNGKLKEILMNMGMEIAFSDIADFKNITHDLDLKIGQVLHKTVLNVNKQGLEAAAVTVVDLVYESMMRIKYTEMNVNKPFLVAIKHVEEAELLFVGKIEKL
jgi:serpin B